MATPPGEEKPTPESIAAYVKSNAANAKRAQEMHHGESLVTRETDYKGHHIVVRTKYEVEVDGKNLYFDQWDYDMKIEREPGPNF